MSVAILSQLLALFAVGVAFIFGEKSARRGAFVILIMIIFANVGMIFLNRRFDFVDPVAFIDDLIGLIGFSYIGITGKRIWPLWAASFQLLSVGAHFVRALAIPVRPIVYAWMKSGPTWAVLILLIVGTFANYRQRRVRESGRFLPN
jgi:hypothetical protein